MITAQNIRELLNGKPFRPFRLYLSDGTSHEVPHPEWAWLVGNRIFVAAPQRNQTEDWSVKQLSILHVTQAEEVANKG
ncbi:MAG: hypothetical protein ACREFE_14505 [Limisphaerales bacterium]